MYVLNPSQQPLTTFSMSGGPHSFLTIGAFKTHWNLKIPSAGWILIEMEMRTNISNSVKNMI